MWTWMVQFELIWAQASSAPTNYMHFTFYWCFFFHESEFYITFFSLSRSRSLSLVLSLALSLLRSLTVPSDIQMSILFNGTCAGEETTGWFDRCKTSHCRRLENWNDIEHYFSTLRLIITLTTHSSVHHTYTDTLRTYLVVRSLFSPFPTMYRWKSPVDEAAASNTIHSYSHRILHPNGNQRSHAPEWVWYIHAIQVRQKQEQRLWYAKRSQ